MMKYPIISRPILLVPAIICFTPLIAKAGQDHPDPAITAPASSQWDLNEKWFLAGKGDIGGFGVGSDLTWSLQATIGYRFTARTRLELGYRYLHTDFEDGPFTYDIDQSGIYIGLGI